MITIESPATRRTLRLVAGERAWRASWTAVWYVEGDTRGVIRARVWGRRRALDGWLRSYGMRVSRGLVVRIDAW